jgi:hypothetical protein
MPCRCRFRFPSQTYTATFSDSDTTALRKTLISSGFCDQNVCLFLLNSPWGVDLVLPSETRRQSAHSLPACVIKPATMGSRVSYTRPFLSTLNLLVSRIGSALLGITHIAICSIGVSTLATQTAPCIINSIMS